MVNLSIKQTGSQLLVCLVSGDISPLNGEVWQHQASQAEVCGASEAYSLQRGAQRGPVASTACGLVIVGYCWSKLLGSQV